MEGTRQSDSGSEAAAAIAALAQAGGRLAIDTEFVSERRYQAQLCLVQVAAPTADGGVRTEVLDPLDEGHALDPGAARARRWRTLRSRWSCTPGARTWRSCAAPGRPRCHNVFDTQVAAGFLGFGNQEGYEQLVRRVLGVRLGGGEGFTRWDKRPLTDKQLSYAADDARCLLALGHAVERELHRSGDGSSGRARNAGWWRRRGDERTPERAYERLPKLGRLDERGRAVARRLCDWRDGVAREMDRPPSFVAPDQVVVELARRPPKDRGALENIRGLPQQTLHRRGAELVAGDRARPRGGGASSSPKPPKRDPSEAPLVSLAQAVVRHRSRESGVATELIATQSELTALVASVRRDEAADGVRALNGWRRELVGDELRELIAGRRQVSVGAEGELVVAPVG